MNFGLIFVFRIAFLGIVTMLTLSEQGILPPRPSMYREQLSLDGLWNFQINDEELQKNNTDLNIMPVPSSYNDIGTTRALRDYAGSVTYSRTFILPKSWQDKKVWIRFGSVCYSANVTINGEHVIEHSIGHLPFVAEISSILKYDGENRIEVEVSNILTNSSIPQGDVYNLASGRLARSYSFDFFDYSGIDRSVTLYTTGEIYVDDITISTTLNGSSAAQISYDISVKGAQEDTCYNLFILDKSGNILVELSNQQLSGSITIINANLWWPYLMDPDPGYMHTFRVVIIQDDIIIDQYDQPFGIREVTWDESTLKINGKPMYLRGFGRHEDSDFRGKGTDFPLYVRDYNLIRWIGANSYRTSHYPYSEELMDLADQYGIMIINEVPSVNTEYFSDELLENHKQSITELYNRDKNRPSVIIWSCANEPKTQYEESGPYFEQIVAHFKSLDTTRPVTAAIAQSYEDDYVGQFLDIISFNRYQAWYENTGDLEGITERIIEEAQNWHEKYNKPVLISEYGADTLEGLHFLPSFIWSEEYQQSFISQYFKAFDKLREENTWFVGELIWNFADFKTAEAYTRVGGNKKGVFTRSRQPKTSAFLLRKRNWALAKALDEVCLPEDLDYYVASNYVIRDEL